MGEKKKKSLKNFSKGNIRFCGLAEQLGIFEIPEKSKSTPPKELSKVGEDLGQKLPQRGPESPQKPILGEMEIEGQPGPKSAPTQHF